MYTFCLCPSLALIHRWLCCLQGVKIQILINQLSPPPALSLFLMFCVCFVFASIPQLKVKLEIHSLLGETVLSCVQPFPHNCACCHTCMCSVTSTPGCCAAASVICLVEQFHIREKCTVPTLLPVPKTILMKSQVQKTDQRKTRITQWWWEGSVCNRFPALVHAVVQAVAALWLKGFKERKYLLWKKYTVPTLLCSKTTINGKSVSNLKFYAVSTSRVISGWP